MKKEPFIPNNYYLIRNTTNNNEKLFYEEKNYYYFLMLLNQHIGKIADLHACCLFENKFELLVRIKIEDEIHEKYKKNIHQPLSNFFNAYCKGMNKVYGRSGSLFREHFFRRNVMADELDEVLSKLRKPKRKKIVHLLPKIEK